MKLTKRKHGDLAIDVQIIQHVREDSLRDLIAFYMLFNKKHTKRDFIKSMKRTFKSKGFSWDIILDDRRMESINYISDKAQVLLDKWFK